MKTKQPRQCPKSNITIAEIDFCSEKYILVIKNVVKNFKKYFQIKKKMGLHWRGIEPRSPAWQASILPLNHQCLCMMMLPSRTNAWNAQQIELYYCILFYHEQQIVLKISCEQKRNQLWVNNKWSHVFNSNNVYWTVFYAKWTFWTNSIANL